MSSINTQGSEQAEGHQTVRVVSTDEAGQRVAHCFSVPRDLDAMGAHIEAALARQHRRQSTAPQGQPAPEAGSQ